MTYTKGPWHVDDIERYTVRDEEYFSVADCEGGRTAEQDEANAHLIAAAPDLLEALEAYDDFVRNELAGPVPIMDFLKDKPELEAVYLKGCEAAHKATGDAS